MPTLPYHLVELTTASGAVLALGKDRRFDALEYVSIWNGRDLTPPEPARRHAPPTPDAAPLLDAPDDMVRRVLARRPMSIPAMCRHYGVSTGVFARAVARLQEAGEVLVVRTERVSDPRGGTPRLQRVYRLSASAARS